MDIKSLKEFLDFYDIHDKSYREKCYLCYESLCNNKPILDKFISIADVLYSNRINEIADMWNIKSIEELFETPVNPFLTNLLLLSGYAAHKKNMINYKFDFDQIQLHKRRVKEALTSDIFERHYDGIRVSQMLWGSYFANCRVLEVGRLQYEYVNKNKIEIHIPSGSKLDMDAVKDSLLRSKQYISKYFKTNEYSYYCISWLLSKQVHSLLDADSNIYHFYDLFDIEEGKDCVDNVFNFLFKTTDIKNYNDLLAVTSLQIKVKEYLLSGNRIKEGIGILKI